MALSDSQISVILKAEEQAALDYSGEIAKKRAKNLDYYNCQPYGDEVDGQSSAVTSDVADVIEWMIPSLLRVFTQGKLLGRFDCTSPDDEEEAKQKTYMANHVFQHDNCGTLILHNAFKDALLQYTGVIKVYWDDSEETKTTRYEGLSELEYQALQLTEGVEIEEVEEIETEAGKIYNATEVKIVCSGKVKMDNIPPEEFLIAKSARDFNKPVFIGHRSPKTRSDLIQMGFDADIVNSLPADEYYESSEQKNARYHDYDRWQDANAAHHSPNDIVYLGEYYARIDVNGDGVTELWQVMFAGDRVLSKEQVEDHPFAVLIPIPIPHRAIGTCPAEQVSDIQFRKSTLLRQGLNNVYQSNYPRILHSNKVDLDDLLTPRAGGSVEVDTEIGDVAGHAQPLVVPQMTDGIMRMIEYTDMEREIRTGITRYSQGLDAESLNKTATGFKGIMDASQQRLDLIARLFAEGIKRIFELIVSTLSRYQDTTRQIQVLGEPLEINPRNWGSNINCIINVGLGAGDRQEKIMNLNNILAIQERYMGSGLVLSDQAKIYNTLEKLVDEIGLKDADLYFNNPDQPAEVLMAQNQQLQQMVMLLQQQVSQNPLAEAEQIKAQAKLIEAQQKQSLQAVDMAEKARQFDEKQQQEMALKLAELEAKYTDMELKYSQDIPNKGMAN